MLNTEVIVQNVLLVTNAGLLWTFISRLNDLDKKLAAVEVDLDSRLDQIRGALQNLGHALEHLP
jgi:hypothetical protein